MGDKSIEQPVAGARLDALIAEKVMGWTLWRSPAAVDTKPDCWETGYRLNPSWSIWGWKPSTDIKEAWLVAERMRELGHELMLSDVAHRGKRPWRALFSGAKHRTAGQGEADTAPLAICRAALHALRDVPAQKVPA